jgi:hypothetical protein
VTAPNPLLTSSAPDAPLGHTEPRLATPPLRELTEDTSYGFDVIWFAEHVLGVPLDPWEQFAAIHLGELLPDGRPRFLTVLIIVARQNGKTWLCVVLTLYWLFIERQTLVLGTSTNLAYAKESWVKACDLAEDVPDLAAEIAPKGIRKAAGEECLTTTYGCRYKIAASNRRGGRSLTIHRLILDELREHDDWSAWGAATNAMNAVPDAQGVAITNMGDDSSIVLDSLRDAAIQYLETGEGDPRLCILEWSAPAGSDPTDVDALAAANPNLGRRISLDSLLGQARRAELNGGEELTTFKTEVMCMRVHALNPAIDPDRWDAGGTDTPTPLAAHRDRLALCLDVSLDGSHAALLGAAVLPDGRVHVEVVEAWEGHGCLKALRAELPDLVRKVKPRALGWFPKGPAAAVTADLAARKGPRKGVWPPRGVKLEALTAEVPAVCMGAAELVKSGEVVHPKDPMLDQHVRQAQKLRSGDAWVFGRRGVGPIDGTYALAGAIHLARTLPPPKSPLAVV